MFFKKKENEVENVEEIVEEVIEDDEIQTTFNTDDIDELGGEIVEGSEPEIDDLPDVDEEEE